jgi:hypothetical protein
MTDSNLSRRFDSSTGQGLVRGRLDQLGKLGPPLDVEAVQFVLRDLNQVIGPAKMPELASRFASSPAREVYRQMLMYEENVRARLTCP